jgi:hypothetical protein
MAKVAGLEKSLKDKAKKDAEDLRFKFAKTEKQKKFLKDNPNVKTASEMEKMIKDRKSGNIQTRMSPGGFEMSKGGRAGYRMGGKCKLAKKGKGRAYGKNS